MATGDILFLLVFVVLPTAIIVSGVWAVLFVRMRPSRAMRSIDADGVPLDTVAEPPALPPAIDETVTIAAIAAGPMLSSPPEPDITDDAAALPALSEREAIASIDLVAADLLFDQPQPPPATQRVRHYTPTEEMPAVSSAAELAEAAAADHENDDLSDAPELLSKDDNALAEGTPMPRQTEELRPESTATAVVTATDEDADRQMDLLSSNEVAAADAEVADREGESVDRDSVDEFGIAAEPDADVEDPQPHKRGPLRLIPSDDVDPRTRRRTRGAGRLVPRLGRSVRRQEGRVER